MHVHLQWPITTENRASCQNQAGIGHITPVRGRCPTHRGGQVQIRVRHRQQLRAYEAATIARRIRPRHANEETDGGWRVNTAPDTFCRTAATRAKHCSLL